MILHARLALSWVFTSLYLGLLAIPNPDYSSDPGKECYEYRIYECSSQAQQDAVSAYLADALIPAYHRHGIKSVGAFIPISAEDGFDVHTLVPLADLSQMATLYVDIYQDERYIEAASNFNRRPKKDSASFDRINSKLMVAFDSMPQMILPPQAGDDRVFEIRSYESASEAQGVRKVHMFNEGGEIPIFEDLGFQPVFFAQAVSGDELPNLVYMVTYDNVEERGAYWDAFRVDPGWEAIKDLPQYKGTVSTIHSHMVRAIDGSDIR